MEAPIYGAFVRPLPLVRTVPTGAALFILWAVLFSFNPAQSASPIHHLAVLKPNEMRLDSITAAPGQLVSVTISITNEVPVGLLFMRMSYNTNFLYFQSATPSLRMAGWPIFGEDADTFPGEIHIIGVADSSSILQPGSGPVGYLNFEVIDQLVPPGTSLPICFAFRLSDDNRMYDSIGNKIDTNQIDYVCGEIALITSGVEDQWRNRPSGFELGQNYPNPFNASTSFTLSMPKAGHYSVRIYNLAGQVVKAFEGEAPTGRHILNWDGTDKNGNPVSSGIYFYKAESGKSVSTKRMLLVR